MRPLGWSSTVFSRCRIRGVRTNGGERVPLLSLGGYPKPPSTFRSDSILLIHTRTLSCVTRDPGRLCQRNSGIVPCALPRTSPPLNSWGVYTKRQVGQNTGPSGTSRSQGAQPTVSASLTSAHIFELEKGPSPSLPLFQGPPTSSPMMAGTWNIYSIASSSQSQIMTHFRQSGIPGHRHLLLFLSKFPTTSFSWEASLCSGPDVGGRVDRLWRHFIGSFWAL